MEEQFPVPRNTAASKKGNGVISLLWQLRCHCNSDHNKFSSLSNTTVVLIFPNLCLWRRSLRSNVGGIDPEKLYRATLNKQTNDTIINTLFRSLAWHPKICICYHSIRVNWPKNVSRFFFAYVVVVYCNCFFYCCWFLWLGKALFWWHSVIFNWLFSISSEKNVVKYLFKNVYQKALSDW